MDYVALARYRFNLYIETNTNECCFFCTFGRSLYLYPSQIARVTLGISLNEV